MRVRLSSGGAYCDKQNQGQNMVYSGMPKGNQLLAALPAAAYRRLVPHLEEITLVVDDTLFRQGVQPKFAYFPTGSILSVSYLVEGKGSVGKAWSVGREGVGGISLFLGSSFSDNNIDVQFGGPAVRIPAAALLAEFRRAGALQKLLLRYVFALLTQASQYGLCNQHHSTSQRLCRALSRAFDRFDGSVIFVTHARMAMILGVRRESITEGALLLQRAGIINYCRGRITLVDRKRLDERACDCGNIVRRAYEAVTAKQRPVRAA
jgi:Crp-like helix-turn-helix domain